MSATVVSFDLGWSHSALRIPYALAKLSCGHMASIVLRDTTGVCCGCRKALRAQHGQFQRCACGTWHVSNISSPNPHVEADRVTQIGDVIRCGNCMREVEQLEWLRTLDVPIHHMRERWGSVYLYRLDNTSPSNFMIVGSIAPTPANLAMLRTRGICSALSPTEAA